MVKNLITSYMWIIFAGLALSSPLILFYLINDSSAIVIDKRNYKIIILDKSPPTVIKFADLITVDLITTDTRTIVGNVKAKQKFVEKANSVCLKITIANIDNPVYVHFLNNEATKSPEKRAQALHNKLSEIIKLTSKSQTKNTTVKNFAELQLKKLNKFKSNIIRQTPKLLQNNVYKY
ncbi:MAG: hypothetical protein ABJA71_15355 [Ginsengibacter sp.]